MESLSTTLSTREMIFKKEARMLARFSSECLIILANKYKRADESQMKTNERLSKRNLPKRSGASA